MSLIPSSLSWADVVPKDHPFEADGIEALLLPLIPVVDLPITDLEALGPWAGAVTDALVKRFGPWASAWHWGVGEGGGGGPIRAWCGTPHSLTTPAETAGRIKAALIEWRRWIEHLAEVFATTGATESGAQLEANFRRATTRLVNEVVQQTEAEDAWYNHCEQVLSWYLEAGGLSAERARSLVEEAIGGRFESWIQPPEPLVEDVVAHLSTATSPKNDG